MIVWTCVTHAGKPLVPSTTSLPSAQVHRLLSDGKGGVTSAPPSEEHDFTALQLERQTRIKTSAELSQTQTSVHRTSQNIQSIEERLSRAEASLASALTNQHDGQQLNTALQSLIAKQQEMIRALKCDLENTRKTDDRLKTELAGVYCECGKNACNSFFVCELLCRSCITHVGYYRADRGPELESVSAASGFV